MLWDSCRLALRTSRAAFVDRERSPAATWFQNRRNHVGAKCRPLHDLLGAAARSVARYIQKVRLCNTVWPLLGYFKGYHDHRSGGVAEWAFRICFFKLLARTD
jgi:hypothetical protein